MFPIHKMGGGYSRLRSLAWHGVDDRIALGGHINIFNESAPGPFTRRTACWAYGIIGISANAAIASPGNNRGVTLITPDVVIYPQHSTPPVDTECIFVSEDGNSTNYSRTVTATENLAGGSLNVTSGDIGVARLSSALPSTVKPARICAASLMSFMPPIALGIPVLGLDQENRATVANWNSVNSVSFGATYMMLEASSTTPRSTYYRAKVVGDSGRGCGIVVNGEFIFLMDYTHGGAGGGWGNWFYLSAIDSAISSLGGQPRASTFNPATLN